ncbi:carbamoyl phosphate synthase small subunit [Ignicoccus pacificus DSM 13166]|uniref:Carbamoyl phosphate synthase small chain n=1 Tax=Ignicoccus pacificus DSM 13166 TaxID=940294 RepID=A0A977K9D6_9CREN|nr:carbamoyl phosphate synthase small subunit [Ignicoccus pacificus DSM 13166]
MKCKGSEEAALVLEDGTVFRGCYFGEPRVSIGEIVFTTTMNGYPESLTDPSYKGQILVMTHPMVGNYGVPSKNLIHKPSGLPLHYESDSIKVEGFVISRLTKPSHWSSVMSLDEWLKRESIPGLHFVDTRMIVKKIREEGVKMGAIVPADEIESALGKISNVPRYDEVDYISQVKPKVPIAHGEGETVALIDCGVKYGIVRELTERGLRVLRIPCGEKIEKFSDEIKGVILANGPGNPKIAAERYKVTEAARAAVEYGFPILSICLGHQLLNIAFGAQVYKMKYGHRGVNKPVKDTDSKCYIVSENHGYAIKPETVNRRMFKHWFFNPDDRTLEGVVNYEKKIFSVQFHPESSPGPHDTRWIFDMFAKAVKEVK